MESKALIPRTTVTEMASIYAATIKKLEEASREIVKAEERIKAVFGENFRTSFADCLKYHHANMAKFSEEFEPRFKQAAWRIIIDRMGIRSSMSLGDIKKLDEWMEKPKELPEINEANIIATMDTALQNAGGYLKQNAREVFEFLCPPKRNSQYRPSLKTNNGFVLKEKVILEHVLQRHYRTWGVNHFCSDRLRAVDNIFHLLDGKNPNATHQGDLFDAIGKIPTTESEGESTYFKFTLCKNQNLHLVFKRPDLVEKLNGMAGELRLKN